MQYSTVKEIRSALNMTQKEFAEFFDFNKRTVEEWEYGRTQTPKYVINLLNKYLETEHTARGGKRVR